MPVFRIGGLTSGIVICNDSNVPEPARIMVLRRRCFVPTNNGLALDRADVSAEARRVDIDLATRHGVSVIRADVSGRTANLVSYDRPVSSSPTKR